jgi:AcrR family transcriptional regulator
MPRRLEKLRARSADDKELRRRSLVESARRVLSRNGATDLRIEDVARGAGVAKPSVFRYFRNKEELLLEVYLLELEEIFARLGGALAGVRRAGAREIARALAAILVEHPLFVRLSTSVHTVLARRISVAAARRFKLALLAQLSGAAAALEALLPSLPRGSGLTLLVRFHAVVSGLWQLADHAPSVAAAIAAGGLDCFRIDFAREVEDVFAALLRDLEVKP